ncbi:glycosyltransferase family 39 protein [Candidatus Saccharibacteria bacterium]|nr:glycosyltransferase family 39 protein [Candidatus Saccharibacteria bacterium]
MKSSPWGFRLALAAILIIGCLVRLTNIDSTPLGLNADEAYAGYEAWSMANAGTDSHGYVNPVYFVSWGSGMNVLYSYLSVPAVKLLGLNTFSLRITQAILGCFTLILIYLITRRFLNRRSCLIILGLFAIIPWHIMLVRWGLESNILPFCLTLGVFGFVYGLEQRPFLLLAALGFGLSLYSYAVAWMIVPFLIVGLVGYGIYTKRITLNRWSIISGALLILLGLPLLLFILVNIGLLPEIRTSFISMPKMPIFGSGGYSLNIIENLTNSINVLFNIRPDGYNVLSGYGLFFLFSSPLVAYGLWHIFRITRDNIKAKKWSLELISAIWIAACIPVFIFISDANATRLNALFIPVFFAMLLGLLHLTRTGFGRQILPLILATYGISFLGFWQAYPYNRAWNFPQTAEPIAYIQDLPGDVYFDGIHFPELLVSAHPTIPAQEAIYDNPHAFWHHGRIVVPRIDRYHTNVRHDAPIDLDGIYILRADNWAFINRLRDEGFTIVFENPDRKVLKIPHE